MATPDTAARSLAHWSEDGRREMEHFYAVAAIDYRILAEALDYRALLTDVNARTDGRDLLHLLDVACGSGKFPQALLRYAGVEALHQSGMRIDYALLDPSPFSLAEAAGVLRAPFIAGARHQVALEDLDPACGPYDVVWATHALYALEPRALAAAAARFLAAIAPGGLGLIAQGAHEAHYLAFYRAFLAGPGGGRGTPYTSSEQVVHALRDAGGRPSVRRLSYEHVVAANDTAVLEGYLQRCAFDDRLALSELLAAPVVGDYLAGCLDAATGVYRFAQEVDLIVLEP